MGFFDDLFDTDEGLLGGISLKLGKRSGKWRPGRRSTELRHMPRMHLPTVRPTAPIPTHYGTTARPLVRPSAPAPLTHTIAPRPGAPAPALTSPTAALRSAGSLSTLFRRPSGFLGQLGPMSLASAAQAIASGQALPASSGDGSTSDQGYKSNGSCWITAAPLPIMWAAGGQVAWPDGTPMVGTMWLPQSVKATDVQSSLSSIGPESVKLPKYCNKVPIGSGVYIPSGGERDNFAAQLAALNPGWTGIGGYRWLGAVYGGMGDDRLEDVILAVAQQNTDAGWDTIADYFSRLNRGYVASLDPSWKAWLERIAQFLHPGWVYVAPPLAGYGPQTTVSGGTSEYDYGEAVLCTHDVNVQTPLSWDWSQLDPTTQAYPYLAARGIYSFPSWAPFPCDFWRSDGKSIGDGASLMPDGPLACLEFLDALVTGAHSVPVIVDLDGNISTDGLRQVVALYPQLGPIFSSGMLLTTIYDVPGVQSPLGFTLSPNLPAPTSGAGAAAPSPPASTSPAPLVDASGNPYPTDPTSGYQFDPSTGELLDPTTGQPIPGQYAQGYGPPLPSTSSGAPEAAPPSSIAIDPSSGLPYDPTTGTYYDPNTGQPLDPNASTYVVPPSPDLSQVTSGSVIPSPSGISFDTGSGEDFSTPEDQGASIDDGGGYAPPAAAGVFVDASGNQYPQDPATGLPYDPTTGALLDPTTGAPLSADQLQLVQLELAQQQPAGGGQVDELEDL